jgi:hypothetical protein
MRRASALAVVTAGLLMLPAAAAARGLGPATPGVGAGWTAVSSCGSLAGVGLSWTSTGGTVTTLVVGPFPAGCVGATLTVTLRGAAGAPLSTLGPVALAATSHTFATVPGSPSASSVTGSSLVVHGP